MAERRTAGGRRGRRVGRRSRSCAQRNEVALVGLARPEGPQRVRRDADRRADRGAARAATRPGVRAIVLHGAGQELLRGRGPRVDEAHGRLRPRARTSPTRMRSPRCCRRSPSCPKPTIARVHGAAFGGGVGLVACCDIAIGAQDGDVRAVRSEARPDPRDDRAVRRRGDRRAARAALLHDRRAVRRRRGVPDRPAARHRRRRSKLDARVNEMLGALLLAGPQAQREAKAAGARGRAPADRRARHRRHRRAHRARARVRRGARGHRRVPRQAVARVGAARRCGREERTRLSR